MAVFQTSRNIHFIGIGGIGISALAGILRAKGKTISGSDKEISETTDYFIKNGVPISIGHNAKNLPKKTALVIYSLAIPKTNPELQEAKKRNIQTLSYPQAVGLLTREYYTIAICGTHGKSTITSLITKVLIQNNFDPTVIVGTKLKELGNVNFRVGKTKILVLEACEYRRAFLNYYPRVILLHTLDPDHLDYYRDFNDYLNAFRAFVTKLPNDGYFLANLDDEDVHEIFKSLQEKAFPPYNTFTYSTNYSNSDFYLKGTKVIKKNTRVGELQLLIPGHHNRTNALSAFAVCATLGIAPKDILQSLNHYKGASRRFELLGTVGKTAVIDDYAHHPAEIQATLEAATERFPNKKICVVFQPHQYSRTKHFLKEFAVSFKQADCVIIPNIYEVRDSRADRDSMSPQRLVAEIKKHHRNVHYEEGFKKTEEFLKKNAKKFDIILTMGAGDVWRIGNWLLENGK